LLAAIVIHGIYNVGVNVYLHFRGLLYFTDSNDVRTALFALGAFLAGGAMVAIGALGIRNASGRRQAPA
jgi:hypothetical protein